LLLYKALCLLEQFPYNIEGVSLSADISSDLSLVISKLGADKVFYLFDENTERCCQAHLNMDKDALEPFTLVLKSGEENKNLDQVRKVWDFFEEQGAGRNSVLVTVGGGMLTDLGGFAACTFKRGMSFINVPTTLLAMVDASVGGKTGINYKGLKNEIGVIRQPNQVLIYAQFLDSLDRENFVSGFAEMLKAALIKDVSLWSELVEYDLAVRNIPDLVPMIWKSVQIKQSVVEIDPEEKSDRRALNFGHTFAHAFESFSLKKNNHLHHGYAVAYGMIFESLLSEMNLGLQHADYLEIRKVLASIYGSVPFSTMDIEELIHFMRSDKKNDNNRINITMLECIGQYRVNNYVQEPMIEKVLKEILENQH